MDLTYERHFMEVLWIFKQLEAGERQRNEINRSILAHTCLLHEHKQLGRVKTQKHGRIEIGNEPIMCQFNGATLPQRLLFGPQGTTCKFLQKKKQQSLTHDNFQSLLIRGLGRIKIALKHVSLSAILTLALRPLVSANFSDKLMTMFLIHILSVPALIQHLDTLTPEVVSLKYNKIKK